MIIFEHVTKRYSGGIVAVDDLSLEVPDGKVCTPAPVESDRWNHTDN